MYRAINEQHSTSGVLCRWTNRLEFVSRRTKR